MHRNFTLIGSHLILPPGTPKDRAQILSDAMRKTFKDPEFIPIFTKNTGGEPTPLLPEEQARAIKEIPRDPETVSLFQNFRPRPSAGTLKFVVAAMRRSPIRLLAYCLMPNHWHMVLW